MAPRFLLLVASLLLFSFQGRSQTDPQDPLGSAFRLSVQSKIRGKLPPKSCMVLFSGSFQSWDPEHRWPREYNCDPDFYYVTGLRMPESVVVVFSEPRILAEGAVSTLLFLPDKSEAGLRGMGYGYGGKFGMTANEGVATRPTGQWAKFCAEVLAGEEVQRIFAKPLIASDFRKPGDFEYNYLSGKFFSVLAPGYAYEPQAMQYYKDAMQADTSSLSSLQARIGALLAYRLPEERDALLRRITEVRGADALTRLQADLRKIKVDLLQAETWTLALRRIKSDKEVAALQRTAEQLMDAMRILAPKLMPGKPERDAAVVAEYVLRRKGAFIAKPAGVNSGKHAAQPGYHAALDLLPKAGLVNVDLGAGLDGYNGRVTRTLPVGGTFGTELKSLYLGVSAIHGRSLQACIAGATPSKLQESSANGFSDLDKRLIFSTNALGARKVLKVTHVASIGLDLDEELPRVLEPGMVVCLETALYLPDEEGVTAKWRGIGIVLRDMVQVSSAGNVVLTQALPIDATALEEMVQATFHLPED